MKFHLLLLTSVFSFLPFVVFAGEPDPGELILPKPAAMDVVSGQSFAMASDISFSCENEIRPAVEFYAGILRDATGWAVPVKAGGVVQFVKNSKLPKEGYTLEVTKGGVQIAASHANGFFYGFQSLRQLMPAEAFQRKANRKGKVSATCQIPCVKIKDQPKFAWRGILVDVSRHFQTKEAMIELIDAMALSKLNVLHWHLTDDQGWRIEIMAYPKLALDSKNYYTQNDIREVVKYAAQRGVQIVPEVDVPGHSRAAVRSYRFLGSKGKDGKLSHVYNPGKETTYEFLDKVLGEVASLFPASYIHLGADEVGMGAWKTDPDCQALMKKKGFKNLHELQSYFVGRVSAIIRKHGKNPIAWDEALQDEGELDIMSWRGMQPGMKALAKGRKVVFCPVSSLYFDRANSRSAMNPPGYSHNTVNLHRVYYFQAAPAYFSEEYKNLVLGAQGCIWGERIKSKDHMLNQAMLRGCALSEALWSSESTRDWDGFLQRLAFQRKRLDVMQVSYFWDPKTTAVKVGEWKNSEIAKENSMLTWDVSSHVTKAGLYEFTFEFTSGKGTFHVLNAELMEDGKSVAVDPHASTTSVDPRRPNQYYLLKIDTHKPGAKYELKVTLSPTKGGANGAVMLIPAPKEYSKEGDPQSGSANKSGQKQPDEL